MLINENLFIEADSCQRIALGSRLSGDVYLQKRFDDCLISILFCGGNGASIQGNIAASIMSSMAIEHFEKFRDIDKVTESIISMIIVSSQQANSTSSNFTMVKVDNEANIDIVRYGTPEPICIRGMQHLQLRANRIELTTTFGDICAYDKYNFKAETGDRILFLNDLNIDPHDTKYSEDIFWERIRNMIIRFIEDDSTISAKELAKKLILESYYDSNFSVYGDQSCGVIYFRSPRKILICSGPPFNEKRDQYLANKIETYLGDIIICGGTTASIVSRELNREINVQLGRDPSGLPNESSMAGITMITEGVLTLERVKSILENISEPTVKGRGIDIKLSRALLNHDVIDIVVGTRINSMHQDPNIPIELDLRRNIIKDISRLLQEKFFKEINVEYI